jgi:type I restriction enzyme S subunit
MTAQQLKNSILQLAVQGKLVPQDPNDEPASVLLERIRAEKQRLVKEGKIKKDKNESVIFRAPREGGESADNLPYAFFERTADGAVRDITDELPFEIPESWEWVRLGTIGTFIRGSGIKRDETTNNGVPCVRYGEIYTTYNTAFDSAVSFTSEVIAEKAKAIQNGDILMTLTGENKEEIGKAVAFMGDVKTVIGGDLTTLTRHGQNPMYLAFLLNSPYALQTKTLLSTGDIIVHISNDKLSSIIIPLPPLSEQQRIVTRIEELLPHIADYDIAEQKLTTLNTTFPDRLKKSILQSAVQGKLVPQDPADEPASVLLERIRAEKEARIKAGKIKRDKHESVIFRRDNSHYEIRDGVEVCIDEELPFDIPVSWIWARLGDVFSIVMGQSPDGNSVGESNKGIEFHQGKVFFTDFVIAISNQTTSKPNKIAPANSVLLCVRAPVGKVNVTDRTLCIGRGLCSVEPLAGMSVGFAYRLLETYEQIFIKQATGTTFIAITGEVVKNQLIPLPPLPEQERIVMRIEQLLTTAEKL